MKKPEIFLGGAIIDFYVNRKKYNSCKTIRGQFRYVYKMLDEYLSSLRGRVVGGVEIRLATITSNNFWGEDEFCIPPDLNYSCNNEIPALPDDSVNLPIRIFQIDITGLVVEDVELSERFFEVQEDNFHLKVASTRIV